MDDYTLLQTILPSLDGVTNKGTDRYGFYCPLGHRKQDAQAEIWIDDKRDLGICCHDCKKDTDLWAKLVSPHIERNGSTNGYHRNGSFQLPEPDVLVRYEHPDGKPRLAKRWECRGQSCTWAKWDKSQKAWEVCFGKFDRRPDGSPGKHLRSEGSKQGTKVLIWDAPRTNVIIWCEGEKAAAAVQAVGFTAASSYGGGTSSANTDYSAFSGKDILIWGDNDVDGRVATQQVAEAAQRVNAIRVRYVQTDGHDKADAADLPPAERTAKIEELLTFAPSYVGGFEDVGDTSSGKGLAAYVRSFDDIDLSQPLPALLTRSDDETLLYAGKVNTIYGPSGSGKTWTALIAAHNNILLGGNVLWCDYEDDEKTFLRRSLMLGFDPRVFKAEFAFISAGMADDPLAVQQAREFLNNGQNTGLVVIDSAGASSAPSDGADVRWWWEKYIEPFTADGNGVLIVDHVPKTMVDRPRGPIGSQAKLARITGSALAVSGVAWTKRMPGRIFLTNHKDRGGDLPAAAGKVVAVIEGSYNHNGGFKYDIVPPDDGSDKDDINAAIVRAIANAGDGGLSGMDRIRNAVGRNMTIVTEGLSNLVHAGVLNKEKVGRTYRFTLTDAGRSWLSDDE